VETYSESQSDRSVLAFGAPAGEAATVIVMRRRGQVWLALNGAENHRGDDRRTRRAVDRGAARRVSGAAMSRPRTREMSPSAGTCPPGLGFTRPGRTCSRPADSA
jgi:hypothetical protein